MSVCKCTLWVGLVLLQHKVSSLAVIAQTRVALQLLSVLLLPPFLLAAVRSTLPRAIGVTTSPSRYLTRTASARALRTTSRGPVAAYLPVWRPAAASSIEAQWTARTVVAGASLLLHASFTGA